VWLGAKEDVQIPVDEGRYDAAEREEDDFASIRLGGDIVAADMAVIAAERAVQRAGVDLDDYALVVHASVAFQGLDHWSPASYIQSRTVGGQGSALEVRQASNGGIAALELAAGYLSAHHAPVSALITTADKYDLPSFDRYRSDKGLTRGDGATGLVLSRGTGVARLLSTAVLGDTTHEGMYRGVRPFTKVSGAEGWPVDLRERRKEYFQQDIDLNELIAGANRMQLQSIRTALNDANTDSSEVTWWVFPNAGRGVVDWDLRKREFGILPENTTWEWGRTVGHIGAGDQAAGLTRLLETKAVKPGDKVVLAGIGAGFTFGSVVLEISSVPEWSTTAD
jgi:3-oxoacyl-[acyl-carrier-protein] synthase-3